MSDNRLLMTWAVVLLVSGTCLGMHLRAPVTNVPLITKDTGGVGDGYFGESLEAEYEGGVKGWLRYLHTHLQYPREAIAKRIEGRVLIQFSINRKGFVEEAKALSGPDSGGLREEAVRTIKASGPWHVYFADGHSSLTYKRMPIVFKL